MSGLGFTLAGRDYLPGYGLVLEPAIDHLAHCLRGGGVGSLEPSRYPPGTALGVSGGPACVSLELCPY